MRKGIRKSQKPQYKIMIVLGKKLWQGERITVEYQSRLDYLIGNLARLNPDLVVFSGGYHGNPFSEAGVGEDYFIGKTGFPKKRIFTDRLAKNTKENIANMLTYLRERSVSPHDVSVTVVTNDYHQFRLELARQRMPLESLLSELDREQVKYGFLAAAYPYGKSEDPIEKWCSRLYLTTNGIVLMKVNLDGIFDYKTRNDILPENAHDLQTDLKNIAGLLAEMPEGQDARKVHAAAAKSLAAFLGLSYELAGLAGKRLSASQRTAMKALYGSYNSIFNRYISVTDPDKPIVRA